MIRKKINSILVLSAVCWLSIIGFVSAGSHTESGTIDGVNVYGNANAYATYATASTAAGICDYGVTARVSSHYISNNIYTGDKYEDDQYVEGKASALNTFYAPQNHRTLSLKSNHYAKKNVQTWTAEIFVTY